METVAKKRGRPRGKVRETRTVYLRLPVAMVEQMQVLARSQGWTLNRWAESLILGMLRRSGRNGRT